MNTRKSYEIFQKQLLPEHKLVTSHSQFIPFRTEEYLTDNLFKNSALSDDQSPISSRNDLILPMIIACNAAL